MFAVMFEVHPKPEQWDAYLSLGKLLKPELEQIDGFVVRRDGCAAGANWSGKSIGRWAGLAIAEVERARSCLKLECAQICWSVLFRIRMG